VSKSRFLRARVFSGLLLAFASIAATTQLPAISAPPTKAVKGTTSRTVPITPGSIRLQLPKTHGQTQANLYVDDTLSKRQIRPGEVASNSLLIMPNKSDKDDAFQKIREVNGTIVRTIGTGENTVWEVEFASQDQFLKAERELIKDKHLKKMQRNYIYQVQTNDEYFPAQDYLVPQKGLNVLDAWAQSSGEQTNIIGVIDTGVSLKNVDLLGKCYTGYDCTKDKETQKDTAGHGTMVSTTAAAINNNFYLTAGPARNSQIFPLNAYSKKIGGFPTGNLIEAMDQCISRGIKIVNMSLNNKYPEYSISNSSYNSVLHTQFQQFHNNGGLVFNAAGNDPHEDTMNARQPYLIVVSASDTATGYLANFSTYGNPVWFTAPGTNIVCSSKAGKGKVVAVSGTSFSSPLVASIAALIWGAKPSLTNTQVEQILIQTANKKHDPRYPSGYGVPNNVYGYGMPDAAAAMYSALH
jgi:subtilisin family serine protease